MKSEVLDMNARKQHGPVIVGRSYSKDSPHPSNTVFVESALPVSRGSRKFWLDGSVVLQGSCILRTSDLEGVLPAAVESWTVEQIANWWASSARNPGALYIEDPLEGWSACLPDPLGGAIAFTFQENGKSFVSTDTVQLVAVAHSHNVRLEKDPLFQVERMVLGNGGLTNSSYANVVAIEPFEYLVVNGFQVRVRKYDVLRRLENHSLFDLFGELRNDVMSAVHAIANSTSEQVISHLTGGFDSRLVLSAILNQGLQNKVSIFCSGPEGSTDRIVADGLSRKFNLKRSNGAGLAPAPTENMSERLMGPLFASGGITNTGPIGRELSVPVSAMGGGYGEVLRTFFGARKITNSVGELDRKDLTESFMPSNSSGTTYVSRAATEAISNKLFNKFELLQDEYKNLSFVADAYYTHNRNRYHIGQTSLLWSRVGSRFDPLYSVAGFEISRRITQNARASNVTGHDLLDSLHAELLSYPFDYDRYNSSLLELRQRREVRAWPESSEKIKFEETCVPTTSADSPFLDILKRMNSTEPVFTADQRRQKIAEANKMGVNFWQVVYKETGQKLLEESYAQSIGSEIQEYIDKDYMMSLFSKKDLNKKQLRDLYSLGGILTWFSFG